MKNDKIDVSIKFYKTTDESNNKFLIEFHLFDYEEIEINDEDVVKSIYERYKNLFPIDNFTIKISYNSEYDDMLEQYFNRNESDDLPF